MTENLTIVNFRARTASRSRILGIDYGTKKIGLSISDRAKIIASPYDTIIRSSLTRDIEAIIDIIRENDIGAIVFGYPVESSGHAGGACAAVDKFCQQLTAKIDLPYFLQDERLSTSAVRHILNETNLSRQKKDALDDKMAACYILQIVLDMMAR